MMAKLYWRVKQNGKWTWTPAEVQDHNDYWKMVSTVHIKCETEEEEE